MKTHLLLILAFLFLSFGQPKNAEEQSKKIQYEYITLVFGTEGIGKARIINVLIDGDKKQSYEYLEKLRVIEEYPLILNHLGKQRWELVSTILHDQGTFVYGTFYVFKRAIDE